MVKVNKLWNIFQLQRVTWACRRKWLGKCLCFVLFKLPGKVVKVSSGHVLASYSCKIWTIYLPSVPSLGWRSLCPVIKQRPVWRAPPGSARAAYGRASAQGVVVGTSRRLLTAVTFVVAGDTEKLVGAGQKVLQWEHKWSTTDLQNLTF